MQPNSSVCNLLYNVCEAPHSWQYWVFFTFWEGFWKQWHRMCHFPMWPRINYRYFHIYRYVGKHVLHMHACQQPGMPALCSTRHTHNHIHTAPHVQRMIPPPLISLLEKFPTMRAGSNITAAKGLLHSQRILGCWVLFFWFFGGFFSLPKRSLQERVQELFS